MDREEAPMADRTMGPVGQSGDEPVLGQTEKIGSFLEQEIFRVKLATCNNFESN